MANILHRFSIDAPPEAGAEGGSFTPYPAGQVSRWS